MAPLIDDFVGHHTQIDGMWWIAKPAPFSLFRRWANAWLVLLGRAEAVTFAEDLTADQRRRIKNSQPIGGQVGGASL